MPRVADYSIVADSWKTEGFSRDPLTFTVPANIDAGSRTILTFMLSTGNLDDMTIKIRMNGTPVWNWSYSDGDRVGFFQEVMPKGAVKPGENKLSIDSASGDARTVNLSDIVVWWQANI
jgi:hypothetical protein